MSRNWIVILFDICLVDNSIHHCLASSRETTDLATSKLVCTGFVVVVPEKAVSVQQVESHRYDQIW